MSELTEDAKRYLQGGLKHGTIVDVAFEVMTEPPYVQYPHEAHVKEVLRYVLGAAMKETPAPDDTGGPAQ